MESITMQVEVSCTVINFFKMLTLYNKILILKCQGNSNTSSEALTSQNEPITTQVATTAHYKFVRYCFSFQLVSFVKISLLVVFRRKVIRLVQIQLGTSKDNKQDKCHLGIREETLKMKMELKEKKISPIY